jgi:RHS repeat-associated protein
MYEQPTKAVDRRGSVPPPTQLSTDRTQSGEDTFNAKPPSISLPKGGGAIGGIGEKFAANPVTGTGSLTVPIFTSPGRSGFGPQLALSYDSGAGNGPFGFGWNLSLPQITRKTDKGLPRYLDRDKSDVFLLSGAEDLVPVLRSDGTRFEDLATAPGFTIYRYRPRIEGLFARIEQWNNQTTGEIHWCSITGDNITTFYGKTTESRIADPEDPGRVYSWLICASYDDRGNAMIYNYAAENADNVDHSRANEQNRLRTANRYLKRIRYGNRQPNRDAEGHPVDLAQLQDTTWMFEVVLDYDQHHYEKLELDPTRPESEQHRLVRASSMAGDFWSVRPDPFSSHRSGFELRTYRRCHRVLMFHHFSELGNEPCLVRSTEFAYADFDYSSPTTIETELAHQGSTRFASFIQAATLSGFVRDQSQPLVEHNGVKYATYLKKSLPPLEFEYSKATIQDDIRDLDPDSLEHLPIGLDGAAYQWVDLDGEGTSGILTEQAGAWFYKRNLSPLNQDRANGMDRTKARLGPLEIIDQKPAASVGAGQGRFVDLAGDGQLDVAILDGPTPGFYERTEDHTWNSFRVFDRISNVDWNSPNIRFIDLSGDGHADVMITENEVVRWHPSLAEDGFGAEQRVRQPSDEEKGPRLVFADGTQSIYLADMCGDGLTDLVRIRNGQVCYWPNQGYGRFGAKVTMDNAPRFDLPEQFDQQRIRLADIDGSGTNDIIYLGRDGVRLYFNQSGNGWSEPRELSQFPQTDNLASVTTVDLLGNGTACLVCSSPLPRISRQVMRYIDLMGGQKPHLLVKSVNNLGAETHVHYSPSTKFYLADKLAGKPWITRLPFPVHVVERTETFDHISRNRFVSRYAYHHGYFDGIEREFRGFGMVEQLDTEEFTALSKGGILPADTNIDESSHVPPVLTKTWFHTGIYVGRKHVSDFFAGLLNDQDIGEYYREPAVTDETARALLLDDTTLPSNLSVDEEREACRALRGSMLRQEVYALDGSDREQHPYTVTEQNFAVRCLQNLGENRHAVFLTHAREAISYNYERNPADPRISHALTLEVDDFGNVLRSAAIGYGRRQPDPSLSPADQAKQAQILITYTENEVTNAVDTGSGYRIPLPFQTRTYEVTGLRPPVVRNRFSFDEVLNVGLTAVAIDYDKVPTAGILQKRLIEHARTYYRRNNLAGPLPLGELQSLALPFESYKLAFTPALIAEVYGGRVNDDMIENQGRYVHNDGDANWWIPSGRIFFSPNASDTPKLELAFARQHFFLPHRVRDPFHTPAASTEAVVKYDDYDLQVVETRDSLDNRVTVGERDIDGNLSVPGIDYRVLQPRLMMDANRNRSAAAFDALGMVVGTAVMGKPLPAPVEGDSLENFEADLTDGEILDHLDNPLSDPLAIINQASSRFVHDLFAYQRTKDQPEPQPASVYAMVRETHDADLLPDQKTKMQHSFSYSDGFGREIQKKIQAEPGPVPRRDTNGKIVVGADGLPEMTNDDVSPRWVGSGWTLFNNKGKPIRQFEPFFTDTHGFEFDVRIGVSPVLFYDPVERVVATLHPNHTWEKVLFDAWRQESWDVNDTVLVADPKADDEVGDLFRRLPEDAYMPTWHALRTNPAHAAEFDARYPDTTTRTNETNAATKAQAHAATPSIVHFDSIGRPVLTVAHNKVVCPGHKLDGTEDKFHTRSELDIEGNQREVHDERNLPNAVGLPLGAVEQRMIMRYSYDMLGNRIHQASMEAGERWMLSDVAGQPICAWDSRDHQFRTEYDQLRRPTESFLLQGVGTPLLIGRSVYGESRPNPEDNNLRGKVIRLFDQAGVVTSEDYDFKGNLRSSRRQLAREYKNTLDWSADPQLEPQIFEARTTYDALNRPVKATSPDGSVYQPTFNEANFLEKVDVNLRGSATVTAFVTDIGYDAKGQRTRIDYGNGLTTTYKYDPMNFRLIHLKTLRGSEPLQDLRYTFDPAGNITHISDDAQQTIFFRNRIVEPSNEYTYDAVYRLIEATGREHLGQIGGDPIPHSHNDAGRTGLLSSDAAGRFAPNDRQAMGAYIERYVYDAAGNFLQMQHRGGDSIHAGWTRGYSYKEPSILEPGAISNHLSSTTIESQNGLPVLETYTYDAHGNITSMPHLPLMRLDYNDKLQATTQQIVNNGGTPEITYYVYDAGGQRVRKVTERQAAPGQTPKRLKERIYLGGFEVYREYENDGDGMTLERETLHIMDDKQRVALVETRTQGSDDSLVQLIRYQFGNHLGSASLELDGQGQIISYEEYTPYGSTSYHAVRSQTETPKRYRYTGKERDGENGFYYYGARYCAQWLGRWVSVDPAGFVDGLNLYALARNNPIVRVDSSGTESKATTAISAQDYLTITKFDKEGTQVERTIHFVVPQDIRTIEGYKAWAAKQGIRIIGDVSMTFEKGERMFQSDGFLFPGEKVEEEDGDSWFSTFVDLGVSLIGPGKVRWAFRTYELVDTLLDSDSALDAIENVTVKAVNSIKDKLIDKTIGKFWGGGKKPGIQSTNGRNSGGGRGGTPPRGGGSRRGGDSGEDGAGTPVRWRTRKGGLAESTVRPVAKAEFDEHLPELAKLVHARLDKSAVWGKALRDATDSSLHRNDRVAYARLLLDSVQGRGDLDGEMSVHYDIVLQYILSNSVP